METSTEHTHKNYRELFPLLSQFEYKSHFVVVFDFYQIESYNIQLRLNTHSSSCWSLSVKFEIHELKQYEAAVKSIDFFFFHGRMSLIETSWKPFSFLFYFFFVQSTLFSFRTFLYCAALINLLYYFFLRSSCLAVCTFLLL